MNYLIFIAFIILFALALILKLMQNNSDSSSSLKELYPYKKNDYFFTVAEKSFFEILHPIIKENNHVIFPKARLADIISVKIGTKNQTAFLNKIISKHIDYLICDSTNFKPVLAIELDDSSHNRQNRIKRDNFVNNALEAASLPFLRFQPKNSNNPEEIRERIENIISPKETTDQQTIL